MTNKNGAGIITLVEGVIFIPAEDTKMKETLKNGHTRWLARNMWSVWPTEAVKLVEHQMGRKMTAEEGEEFRKIMDGHLAVE